ncbi:unnamed protein product, partial [Trichogramma brassicae]
MYTVRQQQQQQQTPAREFDDLFHGRVRFNVPINSLDGTYERAQSIGHNRDYAIAIAISRALARMQRFACTRVAALHTRCYYARYTFFRERLRVRGTASTYTTQRARTRYTYYCLYTRYAGYTYPTIRYVYTARAYCSTRYICAYYICIICLCGIISTLTSVAQVTALSSALAARDLSIFLCNSSSLYAAAAHQQSSSVVQVKQDKFAEMFTSNPMPISSRSFVCDSNEICTISCKTNVEKKSQGEKIDSRIHRKVALRVAVRIYTYNIRGTSLNDPSRESRFQQWQTTFQDTKILDPRFARKDHKCVELVAAAAALACRSRTAAAAAAAAAARASAMRISRTCEIDARQGLYANYIILRTTKVTKIFYKIRGDGEFGSSTTYSVYSSMWRDSGAIYAMRSAPALGVEFHRVSHVHYNTQICSQTREYSEFALILIKFFSCKPEDRDDVSASPRARCGQMGTRPCHGSRERESFFTRVRRISCGGALMSMFSFLYSRGGQARLSEAAAAAAADMGFERAAWRHRLEGPQQQQQHDKDSMTTTTLQFSVYTCYMYMMNLYAAADEKRFDGSSSTTCLHDPSTLLYEEDVNTTRGVYVCRGTASLRVQLGARPRRRRLRCISSLGISIKLLAFSHRERAASWAATQPRASA